MKTYDELTEEEFAELVRSAAALPEVPPNLRQAALDLWPVAGTENLLATLAEEAVRTLRAVLSFDSWAGNGLALGVRSGGIEKRQLLFSAGDTDIDVRVSGEAGAYSISGQVLGPEDGGLIVLEQVPVPVDGQTKAIAREQAPLTQVARLDDLGEFKLPAVAAGTYVLTLRTAKDAIVLDPLTVGERIG